MLFLRGRVLYAAEGDGGGASDSQAQANADEGSTSDSQKPDAATDESPLMKALKAERADNKALRAEFNALKKTLEAKKIGEMTIEDQLKDERGKRSELERKLALRDAVDEVTHPDNVEKGYAIDAKALREMLEESEPPLEKIPVLAKRFADSLKKPNSVKPGEKTATPRSDNEAPDGDPLKLDPVKATPQQRLEVWQKHGKDIYEKWMEGAQSFTANAWQPQQVILGTGAKPAQGRQQRTK